MDKITPKPADVFQANRDRAAPLLKKLRADGIGHMIDGNTVPSVSGETFETKSPVDGTVLVGRAAVDQSAVTGESRHEDVGPGSPVFAGTVALDGLLRVQVRGLSSVLPAIVTSADRAGFRVRDLSVTEPTLETVFINLTGRELRD